MINTVTCIISLSSDNIHFQMFTNTIFGLVINDKLHVQGQTNPHNILDACNLIKVDE